MATPAANIATVVIATTIHPKRELGWPCISFSYVSCQQICHEHVGKRMFSVKHIIHGLLVNFHHGAVGHCGCGAQTERLSCKATLAEEIALFQNADCGFLADLRNTVSFTFPSFI